MAENQNVAESEEVVVPQIKVVGKKAKSQASGDLIYDIASEVEKLTKDKALKEAQTLALDIETNYFKLGGVLAVIRENTWFEGFETFESYVSQEFGFEERKARYLIKIYSSLVKAMIPWEKVSGLGWTKLKDLAEILTLENVDEWVAKAQNITVKELQALLKGAGTESDASAKTTDDIQTLKFKLKNDQIETVQSALAKAKGEVGTEFDTVALESICGAYLGNAVVLEAKPGNLKELLAKETWEDALSALSDAFPDLDISATVDEAGKTSVEVKVAA